MSKRQHIALKRCWEPEAPAVEPADEEWARTRPGPFDDPEGDEAWRDAVAEHAGPFIPEDYLP